MPDELKIVIADDHPIFREGLKKIIQSRKEYSVIGEAADGSEAVRLIKILKPNIAILDIDMPDKNGFEVVSEITKLNIGTKAIFLTMHSAEDLFEEALNLGVKGFVLKENAVSDILEAIDIVIKGKCYISPLVADHLLNKTGHFKPADPQRLLLNKLTPSEKTILKLISLQKSTNQIAEELFISPKTVETHRTNIASKLNLHGQNSLLKFAIDNKNII